MKQFFGRMCSVLAVVLLFSFPIAIAQQPTLFHQLKAGSYAAGYRTSWVFDYQRTWGDGARPIRLGIWYPTLNTGQKKMLFGRYALAEPSDKRFLEYYHLLLQRDVGDSTKSLKGLFSGSESLYKKLLSTETSAIENARASKGKFPTIIYSLGQNDYQQENTVLFEYLASNGYVVIAVPQMGISPRKTTMMIDEELAFETQVRDLQFAYSQIHSLPFADENKVAAVGMSMGGVYSLLSVMRNKNVKLLIGLDPTFVSSHYEPFAYKYWNSKYYDDRNIKCPMVILHRVDTGDRNNYSIVERLKFSEREIIKIPKLIHSDFTSFPAYTAGVPMVNVDKYALDRRDQQTAVRGYEEVCQTVLRALEKYINNKPGTVISTRADVVKMIGINAPNEEEFCQIIKREGLPKALKVYEDAATKYPGDTLVRLKKINRIGFEYYIDKNYKMAIGAYALSTKAYPNSSDAFENLGEMYFFDGDKKNAAINFKKSLELNPDNKDAQQMMKKL